MSWIAVGGLVIGAAGSAYSANQAGKAADKSVKGANAGIAEQQRQFNLIMEMLQPQRQIGTSAINTLNRLYGYAPARASAGLDPNAPKPPPGYVPPSGPGGLHGLNRSIAEATLPFASSIFGSSGKKKRAKKKAEEAQRQYENQLAAYNAEQEARFQAEEAAKPQGLDVFQASPDYEFRRNEGNRDINNSFAARGGALSGNALRGITDFNSNLASGEFNNFVQRQLQMAGLGGAATSQGVSAAQYTGGNVSNLLNQAGNARASGVVDQTNAVVGGINDASQWFGNYLGRRKQPTGISPWSAGINAGYT